MRRLRIVWKPSVAPTSATLRSTPSVTTVVCMLRVPAEATTPGITALIAFMSARVISLLMTSPCCGFTS